MIYGLGLAQMCLASGLGRGDGNAKSLGMGGAFTAVADDVAGAILYNPAGLSQFKKGFCGFVGFGLMSDAPLAANNTVNTNFNPSVGVATSLIPSSGLTVALSWIPTASHSEKVANTSDNFIIYGSNILASASFEPIEKFLSLGLNVGLGIGSLTNANNTTQIKAAGAFAADLGVLLFPVKNVSVGMNIKFPSSYSFEYGNNQTTKRTIPFAITFGYAYKLIDDYLMLSNDIEMDTGTANDSGNNYGALGMRFGAQSIIPAGNDVSISLRTGWYTYGAGLFEPAFYDASVANRKTYQEVQSHLTFGAGIGILSMITLDTAFDFAANYFNFAFSGKFTTKLW